MHLGSISTFSKGNIEFERKVDVKNMLLRWTRRQDHDGQILTSMVTIVNFSFDVDLKESVEDLRAPTFKNGRKLSTFSFLNHGNFKKFETSAPAPETFFLI